MSDFQINPPDIDRQYLECLNTTFGNWGTAEQFDWYFRRKTIFPAADLLIFRENGKLAAGSGITYRFVQLPDQEKIIAGIMTGSWTLPQYRRKGFFSGIIEESQQQAAKKMPNCFWLS